MAYYCNDCSYRGTKSGQVGECQACGSFNISRGRVQQEKAAPGKIRLGILVVLWAYLIGMIIWKLNL